MLICSIVCVHPVSTNALATILFVESLDGAKQIGTTGRLWVIFEGSSFMVGVFWAGGSSWLVSFLKV